MEWRWLGRRPRVFRHLWYMGPPPQRKVPNSIERERCLCHVRYCNAHGATRQARKDSILAAASPSRCVAAAATAVPAATEH